MSYLELSKLASHMALALSSNPRDLTSFLPLISYMTNNVHGLCMDTTVTTLIAPP